MRILRIAREARAVRVSPSVRVRPVRTVAFDGVSLDPGAGTVTLFCHDIQDLLDALAGDLEWSDGRVRLIEPEG